jgi:hypothetical protein
LLQPIVSFFVLSQTAQLSAGILKQRAGAQQQVARLRDLDHQLHQAGGHSGELFERGALDNLVAADEKSPNLPAIDSFTRI